MPTFRLPVSLTLSGMPDQAINVWHFRANDGGIDAAFGDAVEAIRGFYSALAVGTVLANGTTVSAEAAQEVGTDQVRAVDWSNITVPESGARAPFPMAITVNWRSSSASRRGRGRTFVGPLVGGAVQSDGTVAENTLSAVRAAAAGLVSASVAGGISGSAWAVGVYGLETAGGTPASPHVIRDVVGSTVHDRFAWIRSRGR